MCIPVCVRFLSIVLPWSGSSRRHTSMMIMVVTAETNFFRRLMLSLNIVRLAPRLITLVAVSRDVFIPVFGG